LEELRAGRSTQSQVARTLNVVPMTISNLVAGRTYRHLAGRPRGDRATTTQRYGREELPERRRARVARFWDLIDRGEPSECWPFRGAPVTDYGRVGFGRDLVGSTAAFLVAYTLANGLTEAPASAVDIRHLCDFKPCCNPAHLQPGTRSENLADRFDAAREGRTGRREVASPMPPPVGGWHIDTGDVEQLEVQARTAEFWNQVDTSGGPDACWPWTGRTRHGFGYGQMRWEGKNTPSHRIAYLIDRGLASESLASTTQVRHRCPGGARAACCNPRHLQSGSAADNRADTVADGRVPAGEDHHYGAATKDGTIRALRHRYWEAAAADRPALSYLATEHLVAIGTVTNWLNGATRLCAGGPTAEVSLRGRRLTATSVQDLRERHHKGESVADLAAASGAHRASVKDALHGRSFREAGGPIGLIPEVRGTPACDVLAIRDAAAQGRPMAALAEQFALSPDTGRAITRGNIRAAAGGPIRRHHLTADEAREIRVRFAGGETRAALATVFARSPASIDDVLSGRTHRKAGGALAPVLPRGKWARPQ